MRWNALHTIFAIALTLKALPVAAQPKTSGPLVVNPTNGHSYQLLQDANYTTSAQWATQLGGHLVWIEDQAEQDWVFKTFANIEGQHLLWIGLSWNEPFPGQGKYAWSNGSLPTYSNWFPGEPNNTDGEERYVAMFYPGFNSPGKWNDWKDLTQDGAGVPFRGVVEFDKIIRDKKEVVKAPAPSAATGVATPPRAATPQNPFTRRLPVGGTGTLDDTPPPGMPSRTTPRSPSRRSPSSGFGWIANTPPLSDKPVLNPANGHWYQVVTADQGLTWAQARDQAAALKYQNLPGHLATITSDAEQQFLTDQVLGASTVCWLGASQATNAREPDGDWKWITGEPWLYNNWAAGEPNNSYGNFPEDVLKTTRSGGWNDAELQVPETRFLVEFETARAPLPPVTDKPQVEGNITSINLPAPIEDVVPGRGGQLLILWLKSVQKLAIFDAKEKRIVKYLPAPSNDVKFAANAEKLVVVLNDQSIMQRWNLRTFERELTVVAPEGGPVHSMAMGYASNGPLLIVNGATAFYDPATIKKLDVDMDFSKFYAWGSTDRDQLQLRASGDGSTFAAWRSETSYGVIMAIRVSGNSAEIKATTGYQSYLTPNFNGSRFYIDPLNADLKPVAPDRFKEQYIVPIYGGGYFATFTDKGRTNDRYKNRLTPSIYSEADTKLLITLPEMEEMNWIGFPRSGMTFDKRLHILPNYHLMVSIPDSKDKLVLRPFDLVAELNKSNIDYLFTSSQPPLAFQKGQKYSYQLEVKSKRGNVQYSLESGPPGMTLSKTGLLQWTVPKDYEGQIESVIISITDASAQQIYHTFKIALPPVAPPPTPGKPILQGQPGLI